MHDDAKKIKSQPIDAPSHFLGSLNFMYMNPPLPPSGKLFFAITTLQDFGIPFYASAHILLNRTHFSTPSQETKVILHMLHSYACIRMLNVSMIHFLLYFLNHFFLLYSNSF